jgi:hypothetical protein
MRLDNVDPDMPLDDRESPLPRWLAPFLVFELAIAVGSLIGIANLDLAWLGAWGFSTSRW